MMDTLFTLSHKNVLTHSCKYVLSFDIHILKLRRKRQNKKKRLKKNKLFEYQHKIVNQDNNNNIFQV